MRRDTLPPSRSRNVVISEAHWSAADPAGVVAPDSRNWRAFPLAGAPIERGYNVNGSCVNKRYVDGSRMMASVHTALS